FIAGRPSIYPCHSFAGRSTSGFVAWDLRDKKLVYLKDTWRKSDGDMTAKEGDSYIHLNEHKVPHVPTRRCAGDVYDDSYSASPQQTRTQQFLDAEWVCGGRKVKDVAHHTHYRLVVNGVGRPLSLFRSLKELVQSLSDAVDG
ncbi:hypothetical protein K488DRAFT_6235, partial [Vararia minispora EC-137]